MEDFVLKVPSQKLPLTVMGCLFSHFGKFHICSSFTTQPSSSSRLFVLNLVGGAFIIFVRVHLLTPPLSLYHQAVLSSSLTCVRCTYTPFVPSSPVGVLWSSLIHVCCTHTPLSLLMCVFWISLICVHHTQPPPFASSSVESACFCLPSSVFTILTHPFAFSCVFWFSLIHVHCTQTTLASLSLASACFCLPSSVYVVLTSPLFPHL